MNLLPRLGVVAWGYLASSGNLGTHLDMHALSGVSMPWGDYDLAAASPQYKWWVAVAVPQLTLMLAFGLAVVLVLGSPVFFLLRRRPRLA